MDSAPAVPIRNPMQIATPLPLSIMYDNHVVGLAISRDDSGVHFQFNGENFVGENAFVAQVLRNMNRYATRRAVAEATAQLCCSHPHIGWTTLSWAGVKDTQPWHGDEVWIHTNFIMEQQRANNAAENNTNAAHGGNIQVVDVVMSDDDADNATDEEVAAVTPDTDLSSSDDDIDIFADMDEDEEEELLAPLLAHIAAAAPPRPSSSSGGSECSVCACEVRGRAMLLKNVDTRAPDWESQKVVPPCEYAEHTMCAGCLVRTATNWAHHSIGPSNHSAVLCPHEGCRGQYLVEDFSRVLGERDMQKLRARKQRFSRSGMARCPGCQEIIQFDTQALRDAQPGSVAQRCGNCDRISCYHCLRQVRPSHYAAMTALGAPPCHCGTIGSMFVSPKRHHINRWFMAPDTAVGPLPRNSELSVAECVRQLDALCRSEEVSVSCAHCKTPLHRACACMELTHCGLKRCAVCGLGGLEHESVLLDHWHGDGTHGCPRWATDNFWSLTIGPWHGPKCEEGVCHSATHDCTDPSHAPYRRAVNEVRRLRMVRTALGTLPRHKRDRVIGALGAEAQEVVQRIQMALVHGALI